MKTITPHLYCQALSLGLVIPAFAGEISDTYVADLSQVPVTSEPDVFEWLKPSLNVRARYEFRDQDGFSGSNSFTTRARVGLTLGEFGGFSAFAEGEFNTAIVRDFRSNPANDSTFPFRDGNTVISDPRNAELNQAYLQYKKDGVLLRAGRQRIIRNSAAFIGNVGWRQNEQTFDAVHLGYTGEDFEISYAYSDRAQRIFGEEASGALNEFEGDFHFIDGNYNADFGKVGGYVYLIDVDNNGNVGESNSFGVFGNFGPLYAEFAYQEGEGNLSEGDYDAVYGHVKFTHKIDKTTLLLGAEYLSEDFKTPFATVHAFNGFADAFSLQRIGLNDNSDLEGITDIYAGITQAGLPGELTFK